MKNQIEIASDVNNSSSASTEAHETRKNKRLLSNLVITGLLVIAAGTSCSKAIAVEEVTILGIRYNEYLRVGETVNLYFQLSPSDASYWNSEWRSDDTSIATVDQNGKVTGVAAGKATITAIITNTKSNKSTKIEGKRTITVINPYNPEND